MTWHLTLHRWTEGRERSRELLEAHLSWMREQQRSGRVLIAGPTPDLETGIVVFGHASGEEVDRICATEPFIAAGLRRYERIPWDVHHLLGVGGFDFATVVSRYVEGFQAHNDDLMSSALRWLRAKPVASRS